MTSAEIGALAPSNAIKESHANFGKVPAFKSLAANSVFKSASSSALKSFGVTHLSTSGAGLADVGGDSSFATCGIS